MSSVKSNKDFVRAASFGDLEKVNEYLKQGIDPNVKTELGTALDFACWYANIELAKILLEHGADTNLQKGSAIFQAIKSPNQESLELLKLLLQFGANLDRIYQIESELNGSLLMAAIHFGKLKLAYFLIETGIDLTLKSEKGETAFSFVAQNNFRKLGRKIIDCGFKPNLRKKYLKEFYKEIKDAEKLHDNFLEKKYTFEFVKKETEHFTGEPEIEKVYSGKNFPDCGNPPVHLLSVDLSEIPDFPAEIKRIGKLNVVYQNCADCDTEDFLDFRILEDLRLESFGKNNSNDCELESFQNTKRKTYLKLNELGENTYTKTGITIGGLPDWVQYPAWAGCPKCGKNEFFIGSIYQFRVPPGAEGAGNHLYIFVCPDCKIESVVRQST